LIYGHDLKFSFFTGLSNEENLDSAMTNDEASHEDETTMKLYEQDEDDGLDDEDEFPLDENALGIMHYATIT
jgi:hypothetical protein